MSTPQKEKKIIAIPLKDRDPAEIKRVLVEAGLEEETVATFLKLAAYARESHPPLGMSVLSQQIRMSSGVISQCYSGTYNGDYEAVAGRIQQFFWRLDQSKLYGGIRKFVKTQLSEALYAVFEKTRVTRRIQILESPEQLGKTRIATEYTAENNSGRTLYVSISGGMKAGAGQFVWDIAEALGIPYTIKTVEKRVRIRQALASCDLIIIDELHLVKDWTAQAQREFWDYIRTDLHANGARGIVLIATNTDTLRDINVFRRAARYNVGQLLGRMRLQVMRIDPAEDITEADVEALVTRYYKPGRACIHKLHDLATRPQMGHFGLIEDLMNESWSRAQAKKKALDDAAVLATATDILDELKGRRSLYEN